MILGTIFLNLKPISIIFIFFPPHVQCALLFCKVSYNRSTKWPDICLHNGLLFTEKEIDDFTKGVKQPKIL